MENQLLKDAGSMRVAELHQVLRASSEDGMQALGLARSSYYNQPRSESELNLQLMRLLDEEYTLYSF